MLSVQFDKVMALVEDLDRGEPEGFEAECDDAFLLKVNATHAQAQPGRGVRLRALAPAWEGPVHTQTMRE